jgi:hypothetical protein
MKKGKLGRLILAAVLFSSLFMLTGCPSAPSFIRIGDPSVIINGADEAILTYQVQDTVNTGVAYMQKLGTDGEFLWEGKGVILNTNSITSYSHGILLVNSDNNCTISVWPYFDIITAQKVDSNGNLLWDTVDISTSGMDPGEKAVSDGFGGVIIAWLHNSDLYLQRIDSQGNVLWPSDSLLSNIYFFDISGDDSGNVFLVTEDNSFNVCAQKVDSTGNIAWADDGTLLSTQDKPGVGMSKIISDGESGAIITWICEMRNEDTAGIASQDVYAQRIDADGNIMWQTGGVPVYMTQGDEVVPTFEPRIIASENGSVIILWRNNLSIYGQRIDADGNILWEDNGVEIWGGGNIQGGANTNVVSDNNGGLIVVWCYTPEGSYTDDDMIIHAQRVSIDGQNLWGEDGIKFSNDSTNYSHLPLITQYGNGGIIAVWEAGRSVNDTGSAYMQKISFDGNLLWGDGGIKLDY